MGLWLHWVIGSPASFMPGTVKKCYLFQLPSGRARGIMEAILALKMRSVRFSILRYPSILDVMSVFSASIPTTPAMERSGLLWIRITIHLIHYMVCILNTAHCQGISHSWVKYAHGIMTVRFSFLGSLDGATLNETFEKSVGRQVLNQDFMTVIVDGRQHCEAFLTLQNDDGSQYTRQGLRVWHQ